jgi:adenylylsulfate kinase-like enzyme
MTGITAPYEEPEGCDLVVETDRLSLDESVDLVICKLMEWGIIHSELSSETATVFR